MSVTIWCYFCLPETRNLSYAELDILFGNKISARKFENVKIQDEAAAGDGKFTHADAADMGIVDPDRKVDPGVADEKARVETLE